ncbi:hypothetical protein B0J18DRAFT_259743 [Chaetomium sp. MPI-SDFR-AT-0129]|nr:hypothetical protein B0J18DRAFT_259743 [Chaetomium sp. MPI-SDFR-AT-0129]
MATVTKTIVATGVSSGLGFEVIKQLLLAQHLPAPTVFPPKAAYNIILGARDVTNTRAAFDGLGYDAARHQVTVLPLELSDLKGTKGFASEVLSLLGAGEKKKLDFLLLNAAISGSGQKTGPWGWNEGLTVNHFSQHYLTHLLREKLIESKSRVVVVSSGAVRNVPDTGVLEKELQAGSGVEPMTTYCQTKFVQLLGAHWWRRQLQGQVEVVAVSPGFIPGTGLGRGSGVTIPPSLPDAKSVPEGAQSILNAFTRDDIPEDPEQIFLTSWGEWWPKDVYGLTLDKALQDKWSPSREEIEEEAGLSD